MPLAAFTKLTKKLTHGHTSLLVQLWTGHIVLNKHLLIIGKATTPMCTACEWADETIHHYLYWCRGYHQQRPKLEQLLRRGVKSDKKLLASPKVMSALFKYIHDNLKIHKQLWKCPTTRRRRGQIERLGEQRKGERKGRCHAEKKHKHSKHHPTQASLDIPRASPM